MTKTKPSPNWAEIETRYTVNGEKPQDIARDYKVSPRTITKKAVEGKWGSKRSQIGAEIRESAINLRQSITEKYLREINEACDLVYEARKDGLTGLTVQDGEGFMNKAVELAYKAGLDIAKGNDQNITLSGGFQPVPVVINGRN